MQKYWSALPVFFLIATLLNPYKTSLYIAAVKAPKIQVNVLIE